MKTKTCKIRSHVAMSESHSGPVQKIVERLGNEGKLMKAIQCINPNGNLQSCNYTAQAIMDTIQSHQPTGCNTSVTVEPSWLEWLCSCFGTPESRPMTQDEMVDDIGTRLSNPIALCIQISPDHYFVVVSTGGEHVRILQAFQDSYNLVQWLNQGPGEMEKTGFIAMMRNLVSKNGLMRTNAAVSLFSLSGGTSSGTSASADEISKYFDKDVEIKSYCFKSLQ
jgi:hypothetical protein